MEKHDERSASNLLSDATPKHELHKALQTDDNMSLQSDELNEINEASKADNAWLETQEMNQSEIHWLDNLGEPERKSLRFVGSGIAGKDHVVMTINLSKQFKNHVQNSDWNDDCLFFLVGKYKKSISASTHWVAINPKPVKGDPRTYNKLAEWINKSEGRFCFCLTKEFVTNSRQMTRFGNQRLVLKASFGKGAVAGNSINISCD